MNENPPAPPPGPTGAQLAAVATDVLSRNTIVLLIVDPGRCSGLPAYLNRAEPVKLNLSHQYQPPMNIQCTPHGLLFDASFCGMVTAVVVPWQAVMFFGTEDALAEIQKPLAPAKSPAAAAVVGWDDNVVKVDFGKPRAARPRMCGCGEVHGPGERCGPY
jgi:hypothetical protein